MNLKQLNPNGELYQMRFPNGKLYFGITCRGAKRFRAHINAANKGSNYPVHRAIRKYGENKIELKTLVIGKLLYLAELEIKIIQLKKTCDRRFGYNLTLGGETSPMLVPSIAAQFVGNKNPNWGKGLKGALNGMYGLKGELSPNYGQKRTDEMKNRYSSSKIGSLNPMFRKPSPFKGRKHSEESLSKMRAASIGRGNVLWTKGRKVSNEICKKISASVKECWKDKNYLERQKNRKFSTETRKKISDAIKAKWKEGTYSKEAA